MIRHIFLHFENFVLYFCRLNMVYPICKMFKLLICAVCQVEMKPGEGISVHSGSLKSGRVCLWEGPLLCQSCQFKKEAMEGKRPSRSKIVDIPFFLPNLLCHESILIYFFSPNFQICVESQMEVNIIRSPSVVLPSSDSVCTEIKDLPDHSTKIFIRAN